LTAHFSAVFKHNLLRSQESNDFQVISKPCLVSVLGFTGRYVGNTSALFS